MLNILFNIYQESVGSNMSKKMSSGDASRIQSSTTKSNGGGVSKGSFASRAQSAGAKNGGKSGKK